MKAITVTKEGTICDNASINVKPEGGGPRANVGHLTSIAFPTHGNLTKNLCPRVGTFAFSERRNGTKSHRTMCSSVRRSSWELSTAVSNRGKSTCLYKNTSSHYSFSIQINGAPYFVGIVWIVDIKYRLIFRQRIERWNSILNIFYPLTRRMPLLKITSACRTKLKVGIFDLI